LAPIFDPVSWRWQEQQTLDPLFEHLRRYYPSRDLDYCEQPRHGHSATLLADGSVLMVGGDQDSPREPMAVRYDPRSKTWSYAGKRSNRRFGHTALLLPDRRVVILGGYRAAGRHGLPAPEESIAEPDLSVEIFEPGWR
jgi:hypothetical protein